MKKLGLILILAFTTFFSSCEKDLYEEAINSSEKSLKIRKVSLNDVSRSENPELYKRIDQLKIKQEKIHARLVYDSINNFYYDDENGKVIEDELGVKSYTFPVYRENSDGKIENVLFSKNKNGEFEVFLVKYSFTDEQLKFLSQYEISQQTAVYTNITANKTVELCIEFWEWISYPINEGDLTGNFGYTGEWILKKKICEDYNEYLDPALGNSTGVDPLNSGSGNSGGIGNAYTTPVPVVITHNEALRRKFFVQQTLTNNQETYFNSLPTDIKNSIFQYLADNSDDLDAYSQEAIDFAQEVVDFAMTNQSVYDNQGASTAVIITLNLLNSNQLQNIGSNQANSIIQSHLSTIDPTVTAGFMIKYNTHVINEMVIQMHTYPEGHQFTPWEIAKICLEANAEAIHLGLDIAGMAPGVGAIFDVTHGVWYAVSGDLTNASLSLVSAVPFAGDWTSVAKITKRVYTYGNGTSKVILKAYKLANGTIKFSNRGQLRKVLGLTNSAIHAHHVIPYGLSNNPIVQKAAKYSSSIKKAWHPNDIANGIGIPADFHLTGHAAYQTKIKAYLDNLNFDNPNMTIEAAHDALTEYMQLIKNTIEANPNLNLGQIAQLIP